VVKIYNEPDWILEVVNCVIERGSERPQTTINKAEVYGYTKENMAERFIPYIEFRKAIEKEILPLYEIDSVLVSFFKETPYEKESRNNLSASFISQLEDYFVWKGAIEQSSVFTNQKGSFGEDGKALKECMNDFATNSVDLLQMNSDIMSIESRATKDFQLSDLMKELYQLDAADDFKMKLMWIYSDYIEILDHLCEFFKSSIPIVKKNFHIIEKEFEIARKELLDSTDLNKLIEEETGMKFPKTNDVYYSLAILNYNYLALTLLDERFFVSIGIYMLELSKGPRSMTEEALVRAMKALGEPNRMQIIRLLSKEQMFLQELSEHLQLTTATVSHHITILMEANLIMIVVEALDKKRIYYQVCKDTILKITASLQSLSGLQGE